MNAWFFFHNHLELLDRRDRLIVIDKFPETLLAYKAIIERQGLPCDVLYISDCSSAPPLRENIIDCVMDFFAVNEHNFYHGDFYLNQLLPYLRRSASCSASIFSSRTAAPPGGSCWRITRSPPPIILISSGFSGRSSRIFTYLRPRTAGFPSIPGPTWAWAFTCRGRRCTFSPTTPPSAGRAAVSSKVE